MSLEDLPRASLSAQPEQEKALRYRGISREDVKNTKPVLFDY
jgi:hypothetical protein